MRQYFGLAIVMAVLSGCGVESIDASLDPAVNDAVTYQQLSAINDELRRDSARQMAEEGVTHQLPATGSVTYVGTASFSLDASPAILALAELQADFGSDAISGRLFDFRAGSGTVFDGTLAMTNGTIDPSDSSVIVDISGNLTSGSAAMATVDVTGSFDGQFIGDDHGYLRGYTTAEWVTNAGTATEQTQTMQGELTATR
ncbi:hypothetical protein [Flavimaricola marinus]|uniref:Transferrin-binding protein B C-lobe/N-lobe beta barrel domain-containing protein n=1 Tax=Flavimaricola marinus TaxID=1819565 RepID=A0A238LGF9_9RHOB|nr:hypothetical protein [Flavimaricola marinus]SMY07980.1 hypothetical protein LOM8899_02126 [Flavimaricola marinus]